MKIKICGIKRLLDVEAVNQSLVDYTGFVFAGSKRRITAEQAAILKKGLDSRIKAVGVFVNEQAAFIEKLCRDAVIDLVQLHGEEDADYIQDLRKRTGRPVMKAVRVKEISQTVKELLLPADYFLFDSYTENEHGGSGKVLDLSLLKAALSASSGHVKYFLAGGICAGNIKDILVAVDAFPIKPYGIDISSGAETEGKKDSGKIQHLTEMIHPA